MDDKTAVLDRYVALALELETETSALGTLEIRVSGFGHPVVSVRGDGWLDYARAHGEAGPWYGEQERPQRNWTWMVGRVRICSHENYIEAGVPAADCKLGEVSHG